MNDTDTVGAAGTPGRVGAKAQSAPTLVTIDIKDTDPVPTVSERTILVLASGTAAPGVLPVRRRRAC